MDFSFDSICLAFSIPSSIHRADEINSVSEFGNLKGIVLKLPLCIRSSSSWMI